MKNVKSVHIAWMIPATFFFHLLEEFFGGFSIWFSELFNADLSKGNFIAINAVALTIILILAILYSYGKIKRIVLVVLGAMFFLNGVLHLLLSIFTMKYSPGTITGLILFVPLGVLIYKNVFPSLTRADRRNGILMGSLILMGVFFIALNI